MKQDRLSRCLSDVDSRFIAEAEQYRRKSTGAWVKWAAACLCVVAIGVAYMVLRDERIPISPPDSTHGSDHAVFIPPIQIPKTIDGTKASMIALVVYQGRVYTVSYYRFADAEWIDTLTGDYLGRATGHIDEWSPQEEYQKELASNIAGDVYTVRGYSPDFRICLKDSYLDESGTEVHCLKFFENLNGIGLTYGSDLFGDRLGLRERWESVSAESHESWNNSLNQFKTLENTEAFGAFIEELYAGRFEYTNETLPDIYDMENQAHITFTLTDGTAVELRLIEGGYVGYDPLPWYFVKMPGDSFDAVFAAAR